jgi:hypothetical protein
VGGDGMFENAGLERSALPGEQTWLAHVKGYEFHSDYQTTLQGRAMQISREFGVLCELRGSSLRSLRLKSFDPPEHSKKILTAKVAKRCRKDREGTASSKFLASYLARIQLQRV